MLHCLEVNDGMTNLVRSATNENTHTHRSQDVLEVMGPFQRNLRHRHDLLLKVAIASVDVGAAYECSFFNGSLTAEPEQLCSGAMGQFARGGIVGIENREIIGPLVFEDSLFGGDVICKSFVPIEMVGRDVQNHSDARTEIDNRFQLKARDFKHRPRRRPSLTYKTNGGGSDISANQCREISSSDNLAGQGSRGCFAVGSRNRDNRTFQKLRSEFDLTYDRLSQTAGLYQLWRVDRHTRTDHDKILSPEGTFTVAAGLDRDPVLQQQQDFIAKLSFRLRIRHRDPRTPRFEKKCGGHAGLAQANDEYTFVFQFHFNKFLPQGDGDPEKHNSLALLRISVVTTHRNFKVVNANNANTSDAIQKRTMTFDSDQPNNSK